VARKVHRTKAGHIGSALRWLPISGVWDGGSYIGRKEHEERDGCNYYLFIIIILLLLLLLLSMSSIIIDDDWQGF